MPGPSNLQDLLGFRNDNLPNKDYDPSIICYISYSNNKCPTQLCLIQPHLAKIARLNRLNQRQ
jgi:hypothetical protein